MICEDRKEQQISASQAKRSSNTSAFAGINADISVLGILVLLT